MSYFGTKDFYLEVAKGLVANHISASVFGRNSDVDAGTEDIWSQGGTWVPPTVVRIHNLVSSDANDAAAGTGARTVLVTGLNGSYAITSETVVMNGATPVATVNSYFIITEMKVTTAGSGAANAGNITATAVTDATITNSILIGFNYSTLGVYQIPAGYTGYIVSFESEMNNVTGGATIQSQLLVKDFGGVYASMDIHNITNTGTSKESEYLRCPIKILEKGIVKVKSTSDTANSDVQIRLNIILVKN